jgi:hypothetical protein
MEISRLIPEKERVLFSFSLEPEGDKSPRTICEDSSRTQKWVNYTLVWFQLSPVNAQRNGRHGRLKIPLEQAELVTRTTDYRDKVTSYWKVSQLW